jgi:SPP1 family predicted phage head-tail adaptor
VSLSAGRLRHRLILEKRESDQDSTTGADEFTWAEVARPWAAIEPLSVRDYITSKGERSEVSARIVIRFRHDINPQMRLIQETASGQRIFKILGILPDTDSGREYMTIAVSEGVSKG